MRLRDQLAECIPLKSTAVFVLQWESPVNEEVNEHRMLPGWNAARYLQLA